MKKLTLLLISVALSLPAIAQRPNQLTQSVASTSKNSTLKLLTTKQKLDSIVSKEIGYKVSYSYNNNEQCTQQITYKWNEVSKSWEFDYKNEYILDVTGIINEDIKYNYNTTGEIWEKASKKINTIDSFGDTTKIDSYNWNSTSSDWDISSENKYDYVLDGNNIWNKKTGSIKISPSTTWELKTKNERIFSSNGNTTATTDTTFGYNANNTSWEATSYQNDTIVNGNTLKETDFGISSITSNWEMTFQYDNFFDLDISVAELVLPQWIHNSNKLISKTKQIRDEFLKIWTPAGDFTYYYSDYTQTSIIETESSSIEISIKNNQIMVSGITLGKAVTVYNLEGTSIYNMIAKSESAIINLPTKGVYLVRIGAKTIKVVN